MIAEEKKYHNPHQNSRIVTLPGSLLWLQHHFLLWLRSPTFQPHWIKCVTDHPKHNTKSVRSKRRKRWNMAIYRLNGWMNTRNFQTVFIGIRILIRSYKAITCLLSRSLIISGPAEKVVIWVFSCEIQNLAGVAFHVPWSN